MSVPQPDKFEGVITIYWPSPYAGPMPGGLIRIFDGADEIRTVTELAVHASAEGTVWAELTMFVYADGRPYYGGFPPSFKGNEIATGTFAFEVDSMQIGAP